RTTQIFFWRDVLDHRHGVLQALDVDALETDLAAGLGAAGLLDAASGEDADDLRAEAVEDVLDRRAEASAVGHQQDHRRDAPRHAERGWRRAPSLVLHRT